MNFKEFSKSVDYWTDFIKRHSATIIPKMNVDWTDLNNTYRYIFKKNITGCVNCYTDAVFDLKQINEKIFNNMKNLRFKLVVGRNFKIGDRFWNSRSIDFSNEIGEQILKTFGKGAFTEILDLVEEKLPETEKPIIETTEATEIEAPIVETTPTKEIPKKAPCKSCKNKKRTKKKR